MPGARGLCWKLTINQSLEFSPTVNKVKAFGETDRRAAAKKSQVIFDLFPRPLSGNLVSIKRGESWLRGQKWFSGNCPKKPRENWGKEIRSIPPYPLPRRRPREKRANCQRLIVPPLFISRFKPGNRPRQEFRNPVLPSIQRFSTLCSILALFNPTPKAKRTRMPRKRIFSAWFWMNSPRLNSSSWSFDLSHSAGLFPLTFPCKRKKRKAEISCSQTEQNSIKSLLRVYPRVNRNLLRWKRVSISSLRFVSACYFCRSDLTLRNWKVCSAGEFTTLWRRARKLFSF